MHLIEMEKKKVEKKIKTSIYLSPDMFWKLKELAVYKRFPSDNAAMEEAVKQWIHKESMILKNKHGT